jgi:hypothetical protein
MCTEYNLLVIVTCLVRPDSTQYYFNLGHLVPSQMPAMSQLLASNHQHERPTASETCRWALRRHCRETQWLVLMVQHNKQHHFRWAWFFTFVKSCHTWSGSRSRGPSEAFQILLPQNAYDPWHFDRVVQAGNGGVGGFMRLSNCQFGDGGQSWVDIQQPSASELTWAAMMP